MQSFVKHSLPSQINQDFGLIFCSLVGFHPSVESIHNKFHKHFTHMQSLLLD